MTYWSVDLLVGLPIGRITYWTVAIPPGIFVFMITMSELVIRANLCLHVSHGGIATDQ